jgi:hypothetical protein
MGQALANILRKDDVIHSAYRDNLNTIAMLIPYLRDRQMAADKYLNRNYEDPQKAKDALFNHIEYCNKQIAVILGIESDKNL